MPAACGFSFTERGTSVAISHNGRVVTVLRAGAATRFLADVERTDPRLLMLIVT